MQLEESWKYKYSIFDEPGGVWKCGLRLSCGHSPAQSRTIPQNHHWTFCGSFIAYVSEKTVSFSFSPTYLSLLYRFTCTSDAFRCRSELPAWTLRCFSCPCSCLSFVVEHFQLCSKYWKAGWDRTGKMSALCLFCTDLTMLSPYCWDFELIFFQYALG